MATELPQKARGLFLVAALAAFLATAMRLNHVEVAGTGLNHTDLVLEDASPMSAHAKHVIRSLKAAAPAARKRLTFRALASSAADDEPVPKKKNVKKLYLMRHGEGYHNVAQRKWYADPSWDGKSQPFTIDTDPKFRLMDPRLTKKGEAEAIALQPRCEEVFPFPEILVVSPLRRATQTGLYAFESAVEDERLPVLAEELLHEQTGRHTCDRRLNKTTLAAEFPVVDYSGLESEEDPYWGNGLVRESLPEMAGRACAFLKWLRGRPEKTLALASHSGFAMALLNGALEAQDEALGQWMQTGEMRTLMVTFAPE